MWTLLSHRGEGRSQSGMAMYLVDTTDGSESIIQSASGRQTSMATSAPEAEVSAMAERFATAIFLFDALKEIKVITGLGPDCILSMKDRFCCCSETDEHPYGGLSGHGLMLRNWPSCEN